MEKLTCTHCDKEITSKDDFVLGSHLFWIPTPYHKACFDTAKKENLFKRPYMRILPIRFKFFLYVNIFNIIAGLFLIGASLYLKFQYDDLINNVDSIRYLSRYFYLYILVGIYVFVTGLVFTRSIYKYINYSFK